VRQELCNLIIKYGPWGGVVALKSGKVIHAAQYALSAAITRTPLTVCVLDDADEETAARYLGRTYGVFSYEHLDKKTYIQTFAQLSRLHEGETGKITHSTLYETMVIPYAAKRENRHNCYIDFGSGHGDYAAAMRGRGYAFDDVELFRRKGRARSGQVIDLAAVHAMIDRMVASFRQGRRYDATICDSVLNSVDCLKAEASVMTLLNAFTVPGGTVFFSGRPIEEPLASVARNSAGVFGTKMIRRVEFLDKDGFSALFRQGQWFYQKFHSAQQVRELAARFGFEILAHKHTGGSWQVTSRKVRELSSQEIAAAIDYEFNLAVGDRTRLGRHDDVKKALLPLVG
jgi:ParB family chromosome partitioning protein